MEGRWTILTLHDVPRAVESSGHVPAPGWRAVPAVPCDDAAVERAAAAALAEMDRLLDAPELDSERLGDETPHHFVMRKAMEAGFRAAGETP